MGREIVRIPSGYINSVNDPVIGEGTAPPFGGGSFVGQLGKRFEYAIGENMLYNAALGTVYGGWARYVRLAAAAAVPVVGQILFWDLTVADNLYQVTTVETGSTDGAMFIAGVCLTPTLTPGRYTVIHDQGDVPVQFRAVLTSAGAVGSRVYAAGVGAGVDNGFANVLSSANPTLFSDVSLMQGRYLGIARIIPVGGTLTRVNMDLKNYRG